MARVALSEEQREDLEGEAKAWEYVQGTALFPIVQRVGKFFIHFNDYVTPPLNNLEEIETSKAYYGQQQ